MILELVTPTVVYSEEHIRRQHEHPDGVEAGNPHKEEQALCVTFSSR